MYSKLMEQAVCDKCKNQRKGDYGKCRMSGSPIVKWDEDKLCYFIICFKEKIKINKENIKKEEE